MSANSPMVAGTAPVPVKVEAGKEYWWCACGQSASQPFCDGSHAGSGIVPLAYTAKRDGEIWFCTCKQTAKPPLCDGSHKALIPPAGS